MPQNQFIQAAKFIPALDPLPGMFTQILTGSGSFLSFRLSSNATFTKQISVSRLKQSPSYFQYAIFILVLGGILKLSCSFVSFLSFLLFIPPFQSKFHTNSNLACLVTIISLLYNSLPDMYLMHREGVSVSQLVQSLSCV